MVLPVVRAAARLLVSVAAGVGVAVTATAWLCAAIIGATMLGLGAMILHMWLILRALDRGAKKLDKVWEKHL